MARHENNFRSDAQAPLSLDELLALLGAGDGDGDGLRSREDAIACYLAGADGWREAEKLLGGAFAETDAALRESKTD